MNSQLMQRTLHLSSADVPWVPLTDSTEIRVVHGRVSESFVVSQFRAAPGATTKLHRHCAPVFGFTTLGNWGHDTRHLYRPGTYIYETPMVVHRFLNGPEVTEVYFVNHGDIETFDDRGREVVSRSTVADAIARYFAACESMGLPRPNVLE